MQNSPAVCSTAQYRVCGTAGKCRTVEWYVVQYSVTKVWPNGSSTNIVMFFLHKYVFFVVCFELLRPYQGGGGGGGGSGLSSQNYYDF